MKSLEIQIDRNNVEQQMAFDIVANTNTCLFITGKAGTGKTTVLHQIASKCRVENKNVVVLDADLSGATKTNIFAKTVWTYFEKSYFFNFTF